MGKQAATKSIHRKFTDVQRKPQYLPYDILFLVEGRSAFTRPTFSQPGSSSWGGVDKKTEKLRCCCRYVVLVSHCGGLWFESHPGSNLPLFVSDQIIELCLQELSSGANRSIHSPVFYTLSRPVFCVLPVGNFLSHMCARNAGFSVHRVN